MSEPSQSLSMSRETLEGDHGQMGCKAQLYKEEEWDGPVAQLEVGPLPHCAHMQNPGSSQHMNAPISALFSQQKGHFIRTPSPCLSRL